MQTFSEYLNEGIAKIGKMTFKINVFNDASGLAIQAIPDKNTDKDFSINEQVDAVLNELKKKLPDLAKTFWYESGKTGVGLIFRVDTSGLADIIEKALK